MQTHTTSTDCLSMKQQQIVNVHFSDNVGDVDVALVLALVGIYQHTIM